MRQFDAVPIDLVGFPAQGWRAVRRRHAGHLGEIAEEPHAAPLPRDGLARWLLSSSTSGRSWTRAKKEQEEMLRYAMVFLIIALVAALLGFGGLAGLAASIAKILFVVFLVLAAISFLVSLTTGGRGGTTLP